MRMLYISLISDVTCEVYDQKNIYTWTLQIISCVVFLAKKEINFSMNNENQIKLNCKFK
jgi:hypothetical protein